MSATEAETCGPAAELAPCADVPEDALGIAADGQKPALGLWEGSTDCNARWRRRTLPKA
jgi:hypothetical protein